MRSILLLWTTCVGIHANPISTYLDDLKPSFDSISNTELTNSFDDSSSSQNWIAETNTNLICNADTSADENIIERRAAACSPRPQTANEQIPATQSPIPSEREYNCNKYPPERRNLKTCGGPEVDPKPEYISVVLNCVDGRFCLHQLLDRDPILKPRPLTGIAPTIPAWTSMNGLIKFAEPNVVAKYCCEASDQEDVRFSFWNMIRRDQTDMKRKVCIPFGTDLFEADTGDCSFYYGERISKHHGSSSEEVWAEIWPKLNPVYLESNVSLFTLLAW